jgi:Peptidase M1 N-terminal domain
MCFLFFKITSSTDRITLNALDLKIQSASIKINNNEPMTALETNFHPESETVSLVFEKAFNGGEAELFLEFSGELNDKMKVGRKPFLGVKQKNYFFLPFKRVSIAASIQRKAAKTAMQE